VPDDPSSIAEEFRSHEERETRRAAGLIRSLGTPVKRSVLCIALCVLMGCNRNGRRIGGVTPASVTIACYSCDGSGPILQLETPLDQNLSLCFPAAPFAIGCWYGCPTPGIENGQCPNQTP
jgi:hypothetical protein